MHCKCGGFLVCTRDDVCVCSLCGYVQSSNNTFINNDSYGFSGAELLERWLEAEAKTTYQRIFHFNERLSQLNHCEPAMPLELFNLLVQRYYKKYMQGAVPLPDELTKEDIMALCKETKVPAQLQEKYKSQKFKKKPHTDLKRYAEKWISLRMLLGGNVPEPLSESEKERLRCRFLEAEKAFNRIRHHPACRNLGAATGNCHTDPNLRCRHNFPNFNYIMVQLMVLEGIAERYMVWLPQLKTKSKIEDLNHLWSKICKQNRWPFFKLIVVSGEEEQADDDNTVIVPAKQRFDIDESIADQMEMVKIWQKRLSGAPFYFKSLDDATPMEECPSFSLR